MATQSSEPATEEVNKLIREEVITELNGHSLPPFDPDVQRIIYGFTYFKLNNFDKNPELYKELALHQSPRRDNGVGAVIEYAIQALKVSNILVIGHSRCGGIKRLMSHPEDSSPDYDFIDDWLKIALPAKIKVLEEHPYADFEKQCTFCEKESVNNSIVNLKTYPLVKNGVSEKSLQILGGYYDFVNGKFELWEYESESITIPFSIPE
ncbi:PREDICTED: carbonic anhydrase, chloroplastic-like isoform X2 [Lupinus angustifolius]|uniref:carbonic anhydrase, chloroplastic-like isoform X2 n=1 Tax=Lupinus angustifolius TaxID=3871 RepID=UPI00092F724D|nr:PREDICTED: carbonic anhydrase, chloroplastic-like isoform X2 [Lupinus angustifolius]